MFRIIRVANKCIENIDMVQNAKQIDKDDLIGQAYFVRAFAHFTLCRIFGGMPYLDKALEADDEWDMTRLSAWETYTRCAGTSTAPTTISSPPGKVRRDAGPRLEGHLTSSDMAYPNGVAAKGAESPLPALRGQRTGTTCTARATGSDAAEACAEAIRIAEENGYGMLDFSLWNSNFYGTKYTNEHIWAWNYGSSKINTSTWSGTFAYPLRTTRTAAATCPTQISWTASKRSTATRF